jgi:hypothetical protein
VCYMYGYGGPGGVQCAGLLLHVWQHAHEGGCSICLTTPCRAHPQAHDPSCSCSFQGRYLHEMALRILLNSLESSATRYKRHIEPILCLSIDFYVRVFVRVHESAAQASLTCMRRSYVAQSQGCGHFTLQPVHRESTSKLKVMAPAI